MLCDINKIILEQIICVDFMRRLLCQCAFDSFLYTFCYHMVWHCEFTFVFDKGLFGVYVFFFPIF